MNLIKYRMNPKKIRKLIIVIIALVVIFFVVKKTGLIGKNQTIEITTELAQRRTIIETVTANGKVQPEVEVKISADVSGEIIELFFKEGDEVKKGDLLVKINPDIYVSIRERAVAALNSSKANLANSKARLAQAKAQYINTEASFKRNQTLFKDAAISQSDFDAAQAAYDVAKAEIEAAQQNVLGTEYNIKSAEASLKEASDNLQKTSILAPVNGTISMLNIEQGERVVGTSQMAGTEIMRIANLKEMEVQVDVNENDIVRLNLGDTADIEVDAYAKRKFQGIVTQIANSAKTTGLSADQVTNFEVKIRILRTSYADLLDKKNPNLSPFRPGMSATVDVKTKIVKNALSVSIQSVTMREDSAISKINEKKETSSLDKREEIVFLLDNEKAKIQKVKTGIQDTKYIEILSGLKPNQEIILGPYMAVSKELKDGDLVKKEVKKEDSDQK